MGYYKRDRNQTDPFLVRKKKQGNLYILFNNGTCESVNTCRYRNRRGSFGGRLGATFC